MLFMTIISCNVHYNSQKNLTA